MHDNAEIGLVSSLKFFERQDYRGDLFRIGNRILPVSNKTTVEVFVNDARMALYNCLIYGDLATEERFQSLAWHSVA